MTISLSLLSIYTAAALSLTLYANNLATAFVSLSSESTFLFIVLCPLAYESRCKSMISHRISCSAEIAWFGMFKAARPALMYVSVHTTPHKSIASLSNSTFKFSKRILRRVLRWSFESGLKLSTSFHRATSWIKSSLVTLFLSLAKP